MKILAISNLYPPRIVGSYELVCQWTLDALKKAGHQVTVLTCDWPAPDDEPGVLRRLKFHQRLLGITHDLDPRSWATRDAAVLQDVFDHVKPDLISLWNQDCLSKRLPAVWSAWNVPTVLHVADRWLTRLQGRWYRRQGDSWARSLEDETLYAPDYDGDATPFTLPPTQTPSRFLARWHAARGLRFSPLRVIRFPLPRYFFAPRAESAPSSDHARTRLVSYGRLSREKGVHTAVEALARLFESGRRDFRYDFYAVKIEDEAYVAALRATIAERGLSDHVRILPGVPHHELPMLLDGYDLMLFTSECEEAMPLAVAEAFARRLPVIGTACGGTGEIARHAENCRVYPEGDAQALFRELERALAHPGSLDPLVEAAQEVAWREFHPDACFRAMIAFYEQVASGRVEGDTPTPNDG